MFFAPEMFYQSCVDHHSRIMVAMTTGRCIVFGEGYFVSLRCATEQQEDHASHPTQPPTIQHHLFFITHPGNPIPVFKMPLPRIFQTNTRRSIYLVTTTNCCCCCLLLFVVSLLFCVVYTSTIILRFTSIYANTVVPRLLPDTRYCTLRRTLCSFADPSPASQGGSRPHHGCISQHQYPLSGRGGVFDWSKRRETKEKTNNFCWFLD